mmetsp:Transcript_14021/g.33913  ORF Transcript_14021/g.33913 Transcript_14021/m.33913 type:complete len:223 (-) Transcript_14021:497-1165(-)
MLPKSIKFLLELFQFGRCIVGSIARIARLFPSRRGIFLDDPNRMSIQCYTHVAFNSWLMSRLLPLCYEYTHQLHFVPRLTRVHQVVLEFDHETSWNVSNSNFTGCLLYFDFLIIRVNGFILLMLKISTLAPLSTFQYYRTPVWLGHHIGPLSQIGKFQKGLAATIFARALVLSGRFVHLDGGSSHYRSRQLNNLANVLGCHGSDRIARNCGWQVHQSSVNPR